MKSTIQKNIFEELFIVAHIFFISICTLKLQMYGIWRDLSTCSGKVARVDEYVD